MIEPQNTVFPVAAEPRSAQQPQGEEVGFGAMLAQSLGLVAQLDPGAVQQIFSGHHQQGETSDDGMTDDNMDDDTDRRSASAVPSLPGLKATALPLGAPVAAPRSETVDRFRPADAGPRTGESSVPLPATTVASQPVGVEIPPATADESLPVAPAVQLTALADELSDPVNRVRQTLTDEATPVLPNADSDGEPGGPAAFAPGEPIGLPVVGDGGDDSIPLPVVQRHVADSAPRPAASGNGIDPVAQTETTPANPVASDLQTAPVRQHQNSQPVLAQPPQFVVPAHVDPKPVGPVPGGSAPAETSEPSVVAATANGSATMGTPAPSTEPRIDLAPEIPVRVDTPSRSVPVAAADVRAEAAPVAVADGGPANAPVSFSAPATSPAPLAAPASIPEPLAAQTSALAERVLQAVDLQRTQPPPRSMVVDIPEIEGLRLVVSVRSGGQVSVTQAGGAHAEAFTPFAEDLSRVLSQRGFVMNGDDRRNGHNPHKDEERAPLRAPRPTFRRPDRQPQDNDLRI